MKKTTHRHCRAVSDFHTPRPEMTSTQKCKSQCSYQHPLHMRQHIGESCTRNSRCCNGKSKTQIAKTGRTRTTLGTPPKLQVDILAVANCEEFKQSGAATHSDVHANWQNPNQREVFTNGVPSKALQKSSTRFQPRVCGLRHTAVPTLPDKRCSVKRSHGPHHQCHSKSHSKQSAMAADTRAPCRYRCLCATCPR